MKRNGYASALFLMLMFFITSLNAQVLVNKAWQDTTGNPQDTLMLQFAMKDGSSNYLTVGNTYATSDSEQLLITKYVIATGAKLWQVRIPSPSTKRLIATDVNIQNKYIYIASSPYDSTNSKSTFVTYKLSDSTGATTWVKQYTPSYTGYAVPAAIREDTAGNVYVAGTEQTAASEFEMTVLKYNSSGTLLWTSHYDTSGLYTGAVGMSDIAKDSTFAVTGYSGTTYGTWDIVTTKWNAYTGSLKSKNRVSNGSGSFISHPVALAKDGQDAVYIVGASEISGPNVDIKVIKYDSLFNQVWVKKWGAADSLDDEPAYMVMDNSKNLIITGYTTHTNGQVDLLVVKYDKNGNVLWSRKINNGSSGSTLSAKGLSVAVDNSNNIYTTGKIYNGSNYDILIVAIDPNGHTLWEKIYDGGGTTDIGMNVSVDTVNNVYVSGTTANSTTKYITLMYSQFTSIPTVVPAASNIPKHVTNQVIVRFKPSSIISPSFFAKTDGQYSTLGKLIDSALVVKMDAAANAGGTMKNWTVERLFTSLRSSDTLSQTRRGDTIRVPDFWATLILHSQKTLSSPDNAEIAVVDSFKKLPTDLVYSQLNYIGHFDSSPNDYYYSIYQTSLHYNPVDSTTATPYGHIHAEPAWNLSTGKSFVRVGIFDSGLDYTHPDFGYQSPYMNDRCKKGYDFSNSADLFAEPSADSIGHGTACAGIIGAVTNNSTGIAGIAGGWYNQSDTSGNNTNGVSLYGAKLTSNIYNEDTLVFLSRAANAIVSTALFANDVQNGYGLNIMNNSWGIDSIETPGYYYSSNEFLLRDAVHTVNREQVIFVASRGNSAYPAPYNFTHLPACYDSSWVLNVTGSDNAGNSTLACLQGGNVDIIAPNYPANIYTTSNIDPNYPTIIYTNFEGTSAAAAHASGVAALLLSYVNDSVADYSNLSQEDVEFLIETSVRDVKTGGATPGYDSLTGYGFLLADSALLMIQKPNYYIKHFGNSHGASSTFTHTTVNTNVTLQFNESTQASNNYNIAPFTNYKCNVFQINARVNHSLSGTEQIKYAWARHSGSNIANLFSSSKIWPHERVILSNYNTSYSDLTNYVYQVMDTSGNFLGWYPSDTTSAHTKLEYSLLIYNPALTEVQKIEDENESILVFPNPSKNTQTIQLNLEKSEQVRITLYDIQGRLLGEVYNGLCNAGRTDIPSNINWLANGIYIYRVETSSLAHSIKFNKM